MDNYYFDFEINDFFGTCIFETNVIVSMINGIEDFDIIFIDLWSHKKNNLDKLIDYKLKRQEMTILENEIKDFIYQNSIDVLEYINDESANRLRYYYEQNKPYYYG